MNRRARAAETRTDRPRANSAIAASSPVTLASAVARNVYGLDSVISTAYGVEDVPAPAEALRRRRLLLGLARPGGASRGDRNGAVGAGTNTLGLAVRVDEARSGSPRRPGRAGRR